MRRLTSGGTARSGFTLIELMVTMTMMVVIGTAVVSVFNSQQRFTRAAADVGDLRTQLQTATAVLPADLRNISATGNDIISMSDSSIVIRSTIVSSVVCSFAPNQITLAPAGAIPTTTPVGPSGTMRLTSVAMDPDPALADSVFIWDDGPDGMLSDDVWVSAANTPYAITGAVKTPGACAGTYAPAGNTRDAYVLTLGTPLRATLTAGSAVRITRGAAYGLYQSDLDSKWYLGYRTLGAADYDYIAGPFLDYDPSAQSGFRFQYFDATGAEITNYAATATVARVEITARARTSAPVSLGGQPRLKLQEDSLRIGVSLRNRN